MGRIYAARAMAARWRASDEGSGAGDTVTAWVGTTLAAGASVREAARVANYDAGVEVGKSGVATVSPVEVLATHEVRYHQLGKLRRGGLL